MLFKHVNNTDVAFEIIKSFFVPEKSLYKLKVRWYNIGICHAPFDMGITQRIEIRQQDWRESWKPYEHRSQHDLQGVR